ncbi:TetR/AcrR family transcriptional regulator [Zavarzinia compransoris]|uniref:Transcriptional regulator n=1 Tax=Zavarzinia compransoris TaxID=1264899 RepID=A0A317DY32_9PROT|nr:TetR/AcrR family transcriptional regulator [Zavarzinia compransoris]PWR18766.1 transcriptional regulator [Zavarzinia compransoris]TDP48750.1 TetR family transcriptional regulator [Zavarzinia compransoris]
MQPAGNEDGAATAAPSAKYEQVMAAASELFLDHGFAGTSMDAVARAAGVSKATVYAYFASKEDLFEAMVARGSAQRFASLMHPDLDSLDLRDALSRVAHEFLAVLTSAQSLKTMRAVMAEAGRRPDLAARFYRAGPGRVVAALTAYLARAQSRGLLATDDPRTAAELFFGMIRGDLHLRRLLGLADTPDTAEVARLADAAVDLFLRAHRQAKPA